MKREFPEISEFSIVGIEQNRKLGNVGNFPLCSKSYWNLLVFVSIDFFGVFKSWITVSVIIRGKRNFRDFRVFDLGYRAKSKTLKSRKYLFFLKNHIEIFQFFAQFIKKLLDILKLSDIRPVFEKLNHSNELIYRMVCGFRTAISPIPTFTKTSKELDSGGFIGKILIDFSKAYGCLPHELYNTQKRHL